MGKLELSEIKQILQNTSSEIMTVQKEGQHENISDLKIEKLKKLLSESENALIQLKNVNVSQNPKIESSEVQSLIDTILKVRKSSKINHSVLQAVLSNLQKLNMNLNEIRIDEKDHKRGVKVERVNNEPL